MSNSNESTPLMHPLGADDANTSSSSTKREGHPTEEEESVRSAGVSIDFGKLSYPEEDMDNESEQGIGTLPKLPDVSERRIRKRITSRKSTTSSALVSGVFQKTN
mmetsp:Transcript_542/g.698  ORF Transcript_542/g.698 Transcript_542/m.698 type:complete len:105 (-) Transcript_542:22-336(-)